MKSAARFGCNLESKLKPEYDYVYAEIEPELHVQQPGWVINMKNKPNENPPKISSPMAWSNHQRSNNWR